MEPLVRCINGFVRQHLRHLSYTSIALVHGGGGGDRWACGGRWHGGRCRGSMRWPVPIVPGVSGLPGGPSPLQVVKGAWFLSGWCQCRCPVSGPGPTRWRGSRVACLACASRSSRGRGPQWPRGGPALGWRDPGGPDASLLGAWPRDTAADTHKQAGRRGTALTRASSCSCHVTKRFRVLATLKRGNKSMYRNTSGYVHMGLRLDWDKGITGQ